MRSIPAFLLASVALGLQAQNCTYSTLPDDHYWLDGVVRDDGNIVALLTETPTLGRYYLACWTPDGELSWYHSVKHQDPNTPVNGVSLELTTDNGVIVYGTATPSHDYRTMQAIQFDGNGQVVWGRFYGLDSTSLGYGGDPLSLLPTPDGGFLMTATCPHGWIVSKLGADAIPVWTRRYEPAMWQMAGGPNGEIKSVVSTAGGFYHIAFRDQDLFVLHTDADGVPQWMYRYDVNMQHFGSAHGAANGDLLVGIGDLTGNSGMMRIAPDGTLLWVKTFFGGSATQRIVGSDNGDLYLSWDWGQPRLTRCSADGVALQYWKWSPDLGYGYIYLLGTQGDSLFFGGMVTDGGGLGVSIATGNSDMNCVMNEYPAPNTNVLPVPPGTPEPFAVIVDTLKTWTMNIGQPLTANELDLATVLTSGPARPGSVFGAFGVVINDGGGSSDPITATMTYDPLLTFSSATPAPATVNAGTVTWSLPPAGPFDITHVSAAFLVPADIGLVGTTLTTTLSAMQDSAETTLTNNTASWEQTITASFDPNDKLVRPDGSYRLGVDSVLDYTIRFQNTGTDTAFTVIVRDTLPPDVDVSTFRMGAASHPYTYSLSGNGMLEFRFDNILLPDSTTNEPSSHGLVNFRIKPILPLTLGQVITNRADIFFDLNPPIRTSDATVIVTDEMGVRPRVKPDGLKVFPVPAKTAITAVVPEGFTPQVAWASGVDGRPVQLLKQPNAGGACVYDVRPLATGGYVLTLVDRTGRRMSARFTKE